MKQLLATCRIEKATKRPAIFYWHEFRDSFNRLNNVLTCYTQQEQHSDASLEYYRADTRPAKTEEERNACQCLIAQYAQIVGRYDNKQLVIRDRFPNVIIHGGASC